MEKLLKLYDSSWEMLKIPEGFTFTDLKLVFLLNNTCFSVDFNMILKIIRANGYRCKKPSTALIFSTIADCYKKHIASGGEVIEDGARILKSDSIASYVEAVPPVREMMH